MANLSKDQIDELKNLGIITTVGDSNDLANQTVDSLKNSKFVTITDPSNDIEGAVTHGPAVESIQLTIYSWYNGWDEPREISSIETATGGEGVIINLLTKTPAKPETGTLYYVLATILPEEASDNLTWRVDSPEDLKDFVVMKDNTTIEVANGTSGEILISATASNGVSQSVELLLSNSK